MMQYPLFALKRGLVVRKIALLLAMKILLNISDADNIMMHMILMMTMILMVTLIAVMRIVTMTMMIMIMLIMTIKYALEMEH